MRWKRLRLFNILRVRLFLQTLRERGITVEAGVDYVTLGHETELVYDDKDRYADCLSLARDECSSRQRQRQQRERQDDVGGQNDQPSHALGQITGGTSADTPEALDILGPWNVHQWHAFHLRSCMCSWMIFVRLVPDPLPSPQFLSRYASLSLSLN